MADRMRGGADPARDPSQNGRNPIHQDVLARKDAIELLVRGRNISAEERHQAELLAAEVGDYSLACDLAGLYVASRYTTFAAYRQQLAERQAEFDQLAIELADQLPSDHAHQITTILATSLRDIGVEGWRLLRLAALLAPVPISRDLIVAVFAHLVRRQGRHQANLKLVHRQVERALADPHQDGLWRFDPDTATVTIHVLARRAAAALDPLPNLSRPTRQAAIAALAATLEDDADDPRRHPSIALAAAHARHLVTVGTWAPDLLPTATLAELVGRYDYRSGRYSSAQYFFQTTCDTRRRVLGANHPDTLNSATSLANALQALGDWSAARELRQATFDARRQVQGDDHPDTLISANNLANTLQALGDWSAARNLHQATYDARRRVLGDDHPDTLSSASNLANMLQELGELAAARDLHQATYAAYRRVLGDDHPGTLRSAGNLAVTLASQGELVAARELFQATYDARRRVLGDDHPETLSSAGNLAKILQELGELAAARDLRHATYAAYRRVLGDDHPDTLQSARDLEAVESAMGGERRRPWTWFGRRHWHRR